jgi:hypothetical protein
VSAFSALERRLAIGDRIRGAFVRQFPGRRRTISRFGLFFVCAVPALLAAESTPSDTGWPRKFAKDGNQIQVFQPQVEVWKTNFLQARAVVQVTFSFDSQPHVGVVWFNAATSVDTARRLVTLVDFRINRVKFDAQAEQEANMVEVVRGALPTSSRMMALDRLLAASVLAQHETAHAPVPLKNDPPIVLWTTNTVAALVLIDGDPVLRPVPNSSLMRVINTASLILFDPSGGTYYLAGDGLWFQAIGIQGPWGVANNPPPAVVALAPKGRTANPGTAASSNPVVFVSTKPAELLHTIGQPVYKSEDSSGLMYLANTDSQLLFDPDGGTAYLLISGRWFSSQGSLSGPWAYVAPKALPSSFAQIDPAGPKGVVLSSVPGTSQAAAANAATTVPQTAVIQRAGSSYQVQFDGPPRFQPIAGTTLQYAVNGSQPVILCNNAYFSVGNAVWFTAPAPTGPWTVAASVPPEIYSIPPSSPLYYVTFVYVSYADENQVEFAYTLGYTGSYESEDGGGPVYGTGYYYEPWVGDYYYGWGWDYGYDYQYRWWDRSWLWRPTWNQVGNLYAVNAANVYDAWPRAESAPRAASAASAASAPRAARALPDTAAGYGYPTTYGRFAGTTRPVPLPVPAQATLVNPYAALPGARYRASEVARGAEQQRQALRVGSAAARDLYATPGGDIYCRRDGNWYRAGANGTWNYASAAAGPRTSAYQPQIPASYARPQAVAPAVPSAAAYNRAADVQALDRDYYARAAGDQNWRNYSSGFRRRR